MTQRVGPVPAGVHAITPDGMAAEELRHRVGQMLDAGVSLVQYRDKTSSESFRNAQLQALLETCSGRVPLLINDDRQLALKTGADGVHLGPEDGSLVQARQQLGPDCILGASCRGDEQLVQQAVEAGADYLAFGCCFPSDTKPEAQILPPGRLAELATMAQRAGRAAVAVGGIDAANIQMVCRTGVRAAAICAALFSTPDSGRAADKLCAAFAAHRRTQL